MADDPQYNELTTDANSFFKRNLMATLDEGTYFTLSPQTISALDILPNLKPDGTPSNVSPLSTSRNNATLYAVLNKCRTLSGQRLLSTWLKHPLKCRDKINTRLEIVSQLHKNHLLRNTCEESLKRIHDLLRISFKIEKSKAVLADLIKVYQAIKQIEDLCNFYGRSLGDDFGEPSKEVAKLFGWTLSCCKELDEFKSLIEDHVDLDNVDEHGEYMVKTNSDENIAKVCLELSSLNSQAREELRAVAEDIGLEAEKTVKLETDDDKGFALKVTRNNEQSVRGNSRYEQLSMVKKDGYRFTTRILSRLSTKYCDAKSDYNSLAKNIIEDILFKVGKYESQVLDFSMAVTLLDVFVAMSVVGHENAYSTPLLLDSETERIHLEKMRHPMLESQSDMENYVPNDVIFSKDEQKFYVITGPNMGGKSTFIKSVAVVVIMAQCGSMIPVDDARISVVDNVLTRIGAGDNQMEGISTFMEEMLDMAKILKTATKNSLIVIDELGRGTSTFDGFGLAWAISKHLATNTSCYSLFATHFHELTELSRIATTVGNLHVKAICQDDKLTMLYTLDKGVCDESYGIHVARYTKFPEHVIEMAKSKLKQFEELQKRQLVNEPK